MFDLFEGQDTGLRVLKSSKFREQVLNHRASSKIDFVQRPMH